MFAALAPRLRAKGWRATIPLVQGQKRPAIDEWQQFNQTPPSDKRLQHWCDAYPNSGVGLCAGPDGIIGVDLDFLHPPSADAAWQTTKSILGTTPLTRQGRAPKKMAFYQLDKNAIVPGRDFSGYQLFSRSGQTVLFGIHPETRREYQWIGDGGATPLDIAPSDLPIATGPQIRELIGALLAIAATDPTLDEKRKRASAQARGERDHRSIDNAASDRSSGCVASVAPFLRTSADPLYAGAELITLAGAGDRHPTMMGVVMTLTGMGFSDAEIEASCGAAYDAKFGGDPARTATFHNALAWARDAIGPDRQTVLATSQMRSIAKNWKRRA